MNTTTKSYNHYQTTRSQIRCIWDKLDRRRHYQLACLLVVMMVSGLAELLSLGAVIPFLAVISNPEQFWTYPLVKILAYKVGFSQSSELLIPATLMFALAAILATLIRIINIYLNGKLSGIIGSDLSCEAYRLTLYQPYSVHIRQNSSKIIAATILEINRTVQAINAFLQLITASVIAVSIFIGLLFVNWLVALVAALIFSGMYSLLAQVAKKELRFNSKKIVRTSNQMVQSLQEGLGAIREVLLDGNQDMYVQIYKAADRPKRQLVARNSFLGSYPRYVIECLGLVSIAFLGGILVFRQGSGVEVIPTLGVMALGAQRLLPALQQIYSSWANLKSANSNISAVLTMLNQQQPAPRKDQKKISFDHQIKLENVFFKYCPNSPNVLSEINLEIQRGESIGLIGSTGSGKTTLVDVIMGLLEPFSGKLIVDGVDLNNQKHPEYIESWRSSVAHVPQNIYLSDSTIAENIAFGVPLRHIDMSRVEKAAEQAQIAGFIRDMHDGFYGYVGERGVRLSGGQRQRIGIARALYKQTPILIFDEATSALDTETEKQVMSNIEEFSKDLTIIIIAHRLTTLKQCNRVIHLNKGTIIADGPPDALIH